MIRDPRCQISAGSNGDITGGTQKGSIGRQPPGPDLQAQRGDERFRGRVKA
jgi:hypothetical protein